MRTFVSERNFSKSASRGHVWSGCPFGIGQIRTVPSSLVEATSRPVESTLTFQTGPSWPMREMWLLAARRTDAHDPVPAASDDARSRRIPGH
jgi:hypothetical protein